MKAFPLFLLATLLLVSCHESLEDRAAREAREFTEKNCPQELQNGMIFDSLTFERPTKTLHYWYTLTGKADDSAAISTQRPHLRRSLLEGVRSDISAKTYKEAGFSFAVTCHSRKNPQQVLISETFTPRDYK